MVRKISDEIVWIHYAERSIRAFAPKLTKYLHDKYRDKETSKVEEVKGILDDAYSWCATEFEQLVKASINPNFLIYLFSYHEGSILLWLRQIGGEDLAQTVNISEEDLTMNRRVLKIALEQCCDVEYVNQGKLTPETVKQINETIEDLLFVGSELIGIGQYLAEVRMKPGTLSCRISKTHFDVTRLPEVEAIFSTLIDQDKEDCAKGIFDEGGVEDFKTALKSAMAIDYDTLGQVISGIKRHHGKENWRHQTIQPGIVVENLIHAGSSADNAKNYYEGLVIGRHNKISVKEAVYKVNDINRYLTKPILRIKMNGEDRDLIGIQKWGESITSVTTNAVQWGKVAEEWKLNEALHRYVLDKSNSHDKLLEDEVEKVLQEEKMLYIRTVKHFSPINGQSISVVTKDVGEMDFVWYDPIRNCIVVADCKYSRARYDMIAYTADYSIFTKEYEKKIENKRKWIEANKVLVCEHIQKLYPDMKIDFDTLSVKGIFIINTPTFYMHIGNVPTTCFFKLRDLIENNYRMPDIVVTEKAGNRSRIKIVQYPYFK